jgi:4-aminobutyrate aminotransferase-like enzyme
MSDRLDILSLNRFDPEDATRGQPGLGELLKRREATLNAATMLFYRRPIQVVRAEGVWMIDPTGRRYLDLYNNVAVVGHCHPHVVGAVAGQLALLNTNTRYLHDLVITYAERLLATFPQGLSNVLFTCTGSESNDCAVRLARAFTGGTGFIVTGNAYHGNTAAVAELSPASFRNWGSPPHVRTVPIPDRGMRNTGEAGDQFAAAVAASIDDLRRRGIRLAGLLVDTILSSDGIFPEPAGFLAPAARLVQQAGGVVIADEVQAGFGRTGDALWGFLRHDLAPDIVTLGKPMGNGYPMGGVVTRPEIIECLSAQAGYFNTFGGSPVAAAAGLAVLDVLDRENLVEKTRDVGAFLKSQMVELSRRYPAMSEVRGAGLFLGIEWHHPKTGAPDPELTGWMIEALRERGMLTGAAGALGNVIKIRPPLCFSAADADLFLEALEAALEERFPNRSERNGATGSATQVLPGTTVAHPADSP